MTGAVRVLVYAVVPDSGGPDSDGSAVEDAYHRISRALRGTPGLLGNELLRSVRDPRGFIVMSEWESLAAFGAWEAGPSHRAATAPLRLLQDGARHVPFEIYEVRAAY
jgi:heme-degrading monooxygenase HmoA